MKSFLAILLLGSSVAMAEGGTGLTEPGNYYNPDYKCSISQNLTLYVNTKSSAGLKVSATIWDAKSSKVSTVYLSTQFSYEAHEAGVYTVEALPGSPVAFLEVGRTVTALDKNNVVVSKCQDISGTGSYDGPYYP